MKLSIEQILIIRQRDFNALNRAFSVALGEKYKDPEYSLTQEDARKVAQELEKIERESSQGLLSPDQQWEYVQEANFAAEAFRDLYYNFFKI